MSAPRLLPAVSAKVLNSTEDAHRKSMSMFETGERLRGNPLCEGAVARWWGRPRRLRRPDLTLDRIGRDCPLLGWFLIISGVLQGIGLIGARQVPYFWLELISAVLAIVIGLLLLRHTDAGLLFFSVLLIIHFMIEGIVKTIFGLTIRPFPTGAGY